MGTADFLLFFDKLFDSVNGTSLDAEGNKPLRRAVKSNTEHHQFWVEAIKVLETIKFLRAGQEFVPPSVKNWLVTIKMFRYLWQQFTKDGYDYLKPRNFNQDPLENFFGCIRAHGVRNVNPTPFSFISSFKTLVINNFSSVHSPGANCEEDVNSSLSSFKEFLKKDNQAPSNIIIEDLPQITVSENTSDLCSGNLKYVAGFVVKKIFKSVTCELCRKSLRKKVADADDFVIRTKQYCNSALFVPGSAFYTAFRICFKKLEIYLENYCTNLNLKKQIVAALSKENFTLGCEIHDLKGFVIETTVHFYILIWARNINRSLKGLDAFATKTFYNKIRLSACQRFEKLFRKHSKIEKMKKLKSGSTSLLLQH